MPVEVIPGHVQSLLRSGQHLDQEVLVPFMLLPIGMVMPMFTVTVPGGEVDLAQDLLQVEVPIDVVLKAQDPLLPLIGTEDHETARGPGALPLKGEPAILVEAQPLNGFLALPLDDPLSRQLFQEGGTVVRMGGHFDRVGHAFHGERKKCHEQRQVNRNCTTKDHGTKLHHHRVVNWASYVPVAA